MIPFSCAIHGGIGFNPKLGTARTNAYGTSVARRGRCADLSIRPYFSWYTQGTSGSSKAYLEHVRGVTERQAHRRSGLRPRTMGPIKCGEREPINGTRRWKQPAGWQMGRLRNWREARRERSRIAITARIGDLVRSATRARAQLVFRYRCVASSQALCFGHGSNWACGGTLIKYILGSNRHVPPHVEPHPMGLGRALR